MLSITLALAIVGIGNDDPQIDAKTFFALADRYCSLIGDVTFLYEGSLFQRKAAESNPSLVYRFQGFYAFRSDGATLLDVYRLDGGDKPQSRGVNSLLRDKLEMLDASPDVLPRIQDRAPISGPGGPGSLNRPDAPERIFLPWYFRSLGDPAEHDYKTDGWESIAGHRCLRVVILSQPRSLLTYLKDNFPTVRFWFDLERGYPLRVETYQGNEIETRTEIMSLVRLSVPDGRGIWFPAVGKTSTFVDFEERKMIYKKDPVTVEDRVVLTNTVKFNQRLSDGFFSAKKHALVVSDEGLRKLEHELERKPKAELQRLPADPESRQRRLDAALAEADRQTQRLEASSAARAGAGWFDMLTGGLGVFGVVLLGGAGLWYWRTR